MYVTVQPVFAKENIFQKLKILSVVSQNVPCHTNSLRFVLFFVEWNFTENPRNRPALHWQIMRLYQLIGPDEQLDTCWTSAIKRQVYSNIPLFARQNIYVPISTIWATLSMFNWHICTVCRGCSVNLSDMWRRNVWFWAFIHVIVNIIWIIFWYL